MKRRVRVELYTDSTYVRSGITQWVEGWERNGWQTKAKQPVKNVDLWKRAEGGGRAARRPVALGQGPRRRRGNERADRLAARGLEEAVSAARVAD